MAFEQARAERFALKDPRGLYFSPILQLPYGSSGGKCHGLLSGRGIMQNMTPQEKRVVWFFFGGVAALFLVMLLVLTSGVLAYVFDP